MATRPRPLFQPPHPALLKFCSIVILVALVCSIWSGHLAIVGSHAQTQTPVPIGIQRVRADLESAQKQKNRQAIERLSLQMSELQIQINRPDLACRQLTQLLPQNSPKICGASVSASEIQTLLQGMELLNDRAAFLSTISTSLLELGRVKNVLQLLEHGTTLHPGIPKLKLLLANGHSLSMQSLIERYQLDTNAVFREQLTPEIKAHFQAAFNLYSQLAGENQLKVISQVNLLSLIADIHNWQERPTNITYDFDRAVANTKALNIPSFTIEQQLKVASIFSLAPSLQTDAFQIIQAIVTQAEQGQKSKNTALAYLILGNIYNRQNQPERAIDAYQAGLNYTQKLQSPGLNFALYDELGQVYNRSQQPDLATQAFQTALSNLEQIQGNNWGLEPNWRFVSASRQFYQKYASLLVAQNQSEKATTLVEKSIQRQIETLLDCGQLNLRPLSQIAATKPTQILYLLNLGDKIAVILRDETGKFQQNIVSAAILSEVKSFERLTLNPGFRRIPSSIFLRSAQVLYQQLLQPLNLPKAGNIIFVPDADFQKLPLSLLHDGQEYLIQRYSISVGLPQLRTPKLLANNQLRALVAAISDQAPSFAQAGLISLPSIQQEVREIQTSLSRVQILKNAKFTTQALKEAALQGYPIIHLATHSQIAGTPQDTKVFAWENALTLQDLQQIFQSSARTERESSLELLVLTACQLAAGDTSTQLGLAGIGIQAGARSTVAGLWAVEDESTAKLMGVFYRGLHQGLSKAESLRQAQLSLLQSSEYRHPYFWSGWVLLGSWL